jgi:hypothetical protein
LMCLREATTAHYGTSGTPVKRDTCAVTEIGYLLTVICSA